MGRHRRVGFVDQSLLLHSDRHDHHQLGGTRQSPSRYRTHLAGIGTRYGARAVTAAQYGRHRLLSILLFIIINVVQIGLRHLAVGMGLPPGLVFGL